MSKLPPEIDNLMWTLAESQNRQAIDEFETRFPDLRIELAKRINMVRGLRSQRPDDVTLAAIPRFDPQPTRQAPASRTPYLLAAAFGILAASAFGYTVFQPRKPAQLPSVPVVTTTPVEPKYTPIVGNGLPVPPQRDPEIRQQWQQQAPPDSVTEKIVPPIPKWERGQDVTMRDVPLLTVAQTVADAGGLKLVIPPEMPNPTISVDYHQTGAADILKDLGHQYAFTPMLSDDGSVLMIPAVARS